MWNLFGMNVQHMCSINKSLYFRLTLPNVASEYPDLLKRVLFQNNVCNNIHNNVLAGYFGLIQLILQQSVYMKVILSFH
jgi:hypothetical protein